LLIEVIDESKKTSFIIKVVEAVNEVSRLLPFTTVLNVWKDEVYFPLPSELGLKPNTHKVELGRVYYWPPGKALCLFYGFSEPYTPVAYLGEFVGSLTALKVVADGDDGRVIRHELDPNLSDVTELLKSLGYSVGTPLVDGIRVAAASKYVSGLRLGFTVYVEPYGYYLESEQFFRHGEDYLHTTLAKKLKKLTSRCRYLRFDMDEDNYAVLTLGVNNSSELAEGIKELELMYQQVVEFLTSS